MALIKLKSYSIDDFFEFTSDDSFFDLIDIQNEEEKNKNLDFVDSEGVFVYNVKFILNKQKALLNNIDGFTFDISTSDPESDTYDKSKSLVESFYVLIDNDQQKIKNNSSNSLFTNDIITDKDSIKKVITTDQTKSFSKSLYTTNSKIQGPVNYKNEAIKKKSFNKDSALMMTMPYMPNISAINAISLASDSYMSQDNTKNVKNSGGKVSSLLSIRSNLNFNKINDLVLSSIENNDQYPKEMSQKYFNLISSKSLFVRNFEIQKNKIKNFDNFYVSITVKKSTSSNVFFIKKHLKINHSIQVNELISNAMPPVVSLVSSYSGKAKFSLTKSDPTLKKVKVTRITSNRTLQNDSATDVGIIDFSDQKTLIFEDSPNNVYPNTNIYRFSTLNIDGSIGNFNSIVVDPIHKSSNMNLSNENAKVSIMAINKLSDVVIEVNSLSDDITSFRLMRQEIGKTGNFSDSIVTIKNTNNEYETLVQRKIDKFIFSDETAKLGKKYRYFIVYRSGQFGSISISKESFSIEDEILIRRIPYMEIPFTINITKANVSYEEQNSPTVTFDINVSETKELYKVIINSLKFAGYGDQFISNFQNDEIKIKQFVSFIIERFDISTGKRHYFGIVPPGSFSDSSIARKAQQIPAPIFGNRYHYIAKACLQQPEVFLQTTEKSIITRTGEIIQKNASRFSRNVYEKMGIMPAERDIKTSKDIESLIVESQIGIEEFVTINIPESKPEIFISNHIKKTNYTKLIWRARLSNLINYFQIFCIIDDNTTLLGAISCPNTSEVFNFKDSITNNEIGSIKYVIKAIDYNENVIAEAIHIRDAGNISIDEKLLDGYIVGTSQGKDMIVALSENIKTETKENFWNSVIIPKKQSKQSISNKQNVIIKKGFKIT